MLNYDKSIPTKIKQNKCHLTILLSVKYIFYLCVIMVI